MADCAASVRIIEICPPIMVYAIKTAAERPIMRERFPGAMVLRILPEATICPPMIPIHAQTMTTDATDFTEDPYCFSRISGRVNRPYPLILRARRRKRRIKPTTPTSNHHAPTSPQENPLPAIPTVLDPPIIVARSDPVMKRGLPLRSATKKVSIPLIRLALAIPIHTIAAK